jgi:alkylhydroperoxidase family enzyme
LPKLLANSNVFFKPFMTLLSSSWSEDRKILSSEWQVTVLRTAATLDAPYEWDVNEPVALVFGFTEEQLIALRNPREPLPEDLFTVRQRLIARIVEELAQHTRVSKDLMSEATEVFSHEEITEIFFLNGIYGFLARFMNSARIDFDEPIPGLLDILSKYNAKAIEREKQHGK